MKKNYFNSDNYSFLAKNVQFKIKHFCLIVMVFFSSFGGFGQVTIFSENFESASGAENQLNASTSGYLGWKNFNITGTNNSWWVFNNTRSTILGGNYSMAISRNSPVTSGVRPQYNANNSAENIAYYGNKIDATEYTSLTLSFKWICEGEIGWVTDYDYGKVCYSTDGNIWTDFTNSVVYAEHSTSQTVTNLNISEVNATQFYIGFRWKNDNSTSNNPSFIVDDIVVKGIPKPTITSLGSTNGCTGSSITINGSNLTGATVANVRVGGTPVSSITSNSGTSIVAVLGTGTTGKVTVTTGGGTAISSSVFAVTPIPTNVVISSTVSPVGADACSKDYVKLDASGGVYSNAVAFFEDFSRSPNWFYNVAAGIKGYYYSSASAGGSAPEGALAYESNANGSWYFYPGATPSGNLPIDISHFASLNLDFRHAFGSFAGSYSRGISVEISTNGSTWSSIWAISSFSASIPATPVSVNLTSYVGSSTLYIRFRYTGDSRGMNNWTIDDVKISGNKEFVSWSPATGLFTNVGLTTPYVSGTNFRTVYAAPNATTIYTATSNLGGCLKDATTTVQNERKLFTGAISSEWNVAGNWSPSGVPTIDNCVTIPSTVTVNAAGNSKTVNVTSVGNINVSSGNSLAIKDALTVQTGGLFTLEDTASLVQEGTTNTNSGNITVNRTAKPMKRYDFSYWSSPVSPQTLYNLSPNTLGDKYYSWNPVSQAWIIHYNGSDTMIDAKGYIVRAPQSFPINVVNATDFVGTFVGKPNSGDITIDVKGNLSAVATDAKWNLIGNPYPSALSLNKFLGDSFNSPKVNGTVYLWTHNSPPSNAIPGDAIYNYTASDYAAYNLLGGTATSAATPDPLHPIVNPSPNSNVPSGFLASGQSFFVKGKADATVKFTNDMREKTGNNQFFRASENQINTVEKHRFWLNLRNNQGAFNQTLVGYVQGATNDFEDNFDGELFGGNFVSIYSILSDKKMTIQGKAIPFENTDIVPLGITTTIAGNFSISLDDFDGLFSGQDIFLKDKSLNVTHDLKTGGYEFASTIGTFDNRFEIIYQNVTLGISDPNFNPNNIVIYKKEKTIVVNSGTLIMSSIQVFDIQGRLLLNEKNINTSETILKNLPPVDQVLIVKVQTKEGNLVSKKIIF